MHPHNSWGVCTPPPFLPVLSNLHLRHHSRRRMQGTLQQGVLPIMDEHTYGPAFQVGIWRSGNRVCVRGWTGNQVCVRGNQVAVPCNGAAWHEAAGRNEDPWPCSTIPADPGQEAKADGADGGRGGGTPPGEP